MSAGAEGFVDVVRRPLVALGLGLMAASVCFGIAIDEALKLQGMGDEPRNVSIAQAASGELGRSAWVTIDDAQWHDDEAILHRPKHGGVETFIPLTDATGSNLILAKVERGRSATGILGSPPHVLSDLLRDRGLLSKVHGPVLWLECRFEPSDILSNVLLAASLGVAGIVVHPVLVRIRRATRAPRPLPPTYEDVRLLGIVAMLVGVLQLVLGFGLEMKPHAFFGVPLLVVGLHVFLRARELLGLAARLNDPFGEPLP